MAEYRIIRGHIPTNLEDGKNGWLRLCDPKDILNVLRPTRTPIKVETVEIDSTEIGSLKPKTGVTIGEAKIVFSGSAAINGLEYDVRGVFFRSGGNNSGSLTIVEDTSGDSDQLASTSTRQ